MNKIYDTLKSSNWLLSFSLKQDRKRNKLQSDSPWVPSFVLSFERLFFWLIKTFFYISFIFFPLAYTLTLVVSGSMTPCVQTNEIVVSSQLSFGLKLSKWIASNPIKKTCVDSSLWLYEQPKIGDVVCFNVLCSDPDITFTKRIVGGPGDKIQFKNGILFINDEMVKLKFKKQYSFTEDNKTYHGLIFSETLPNGLEHDVLYLNDFGHGSSDDTEIFYVPEDHVFCSGDNRHNSMDSRSLFAFVEKRHVTGKVFMILFSNGNLTWMNFGKFFSGMQWDRMLKWMI